MWVSVCFTCVTNQDCDLRQDPFHLSGTASIHSKMSTWMGGGLRFFFFFQLTAGLLMHVRNTKSEKKDIQVSK